MEFMSVLQVFRRSWFTFCFFMFIYTCSCISHGWTNVIISGIYRIALLATPSDSHPLPATLTPSQSLLAIPTHSHSFFKKSDPFSPIFQEKQPTLTHFRQKRHNPTLISTRMTHSHPVFKKNPLPPFFRQKRHTPTHFSTKTIDSHPFLNKIDPFLDFSTKRPTPIQGFYWIALPATLTHSHQLLPALKSFYLFAPQFSTKTTYFNALSY